MQRKHLLAQLAVLLGGSTAEEIALGEISTGAQNDLQRATDIARSMVTEWGMSDALGAIHYDGNKRSRFLDIPIGNERGAYAEDTARLIDGEVKRIMSDAQAEARRGGSPAPARRRRGPRTLRGSPSARRAGDSGRRGRRARSRVG